MPSDAALVAHHTLEFPGGYKRSTGPVVGKFLTGLRDGRILGVRRTDGTVLVPPTEYDPATSESLGGDDGAWVEVGPGGEVATWTWVAEPRDKHPLDRPFAWALILLDGADTPMLHAVDAGDVRTGMRVTARWRDARVGNVVDIECFVPEPARASAVERGGAASGRGVDGSRSEAEWPGRDRPERAAKLPDAAASATMMTAPVRLDYDVAAGHAPSRFLRGLAQGKILGQRCPKCGQVYVPPRGSCPTDGIPTEEEVELSHVGTVTTFCVVNLPFSDLAPEVPYVCAQILLDGANIALFGLVGEMPASEVRMGLRVEAVWVPEAERGPDLRSIKWFRPTGDPDAPYDAYKDYL